MIKNALRLWLAGSLMTATALLANTEENMAASLMQLRSEVEQLDSQIEDEKDATKASMRSLVMEKNELETTVAREELKIKQLRQEMDGVKKKIQAASKNSDGIRPVVFKAITDLKEHIAEGLPFKTADRLTDIEKIETQLNEDLITSQKALVLVWNTYADALRMSKENGLFKQTIKLDGKDRLAEVARLGSVMMYFQTPDNRVGHVTKETKGWYYKEAVNSNEKKQISELFDAFHKQIRTGYFTLPNALVKTEVR